MSRIARTFALALFLGLVSVSGLAGEAPPLTKGQTVYVSVYSHVLHGDHDYKGRPGEWLLSAMLSIRNTDPEHGITVRSVRYYDTHGSLIREYPVQAKALGPMGTTEVFVEGKDMAGGTGANFLVVWDAEQPVNAPIIETVHTSFTGTRSAVFVSPGQPLHIGSR